MTIFALMCRWHGCGGVDEDDEELQELGEGIEVSSKSWVFIPVNDRLELDAGCMHW